jgi:hypothetical protein
LDEGEPQLGLGYTFPDRRCPLECRANGCAAGRDTRSQRRRVLNIHELTAADCLALLQRAPFARLGCAYLAQPYIVPIQLAVDADTGHLYGFSLVGQKITWMRRNPKVCVEVDEVVDKDRWATTVVTGRYEEIGLGAAHAETRRRAETLLQQRHEWWLPGAAETSAGERGEAVLFRIVVDTMTGRRAARSAPAPPSS